MGIHLSDEIEEILPGGMRGEVKIVHLAIAGEFAAARAEMKGLTRFGGFQAATRSFRIGVTDKKDGVAFVAGEAQGEVVRGGFFRSSCQR